MEDKMRASSTIRFVVMLLAFALFLCNSARASAQTRVSVGVTETIETHNPYGDSVSLLYGIWSEVTGPFCTYNYTKGDFEGRLAERWKVENPTTWLFYLSKN
jgi:ABC-type transport system substrate-binding protein